MTCPQGLAASAVLTDWKEYYKQRKLPFSSPVGTFALHCTLWCLNFNVKTCISSP